MGLNNLSKILLLVASFAAGVVLPSLVGCSVGGDKVGRVIDLVRGDRLALDAGGKEQLSRFYQVYSTYTDSSSENRQFKHFTDAFKRVRAEYVISVDDVELIDDAIKGIVEHEDPVFRKGQTDANVLVEAALDSMVGSLDPHSGYLNPNEQDEVAAYTKGEFEGLGIHVSSHEDGVLVISPIEDTPAFRAGIHSGDLITHLDGDSIQGLDLQLAVGRMRGPRGSSARLTLKRGNEPLFDVTIVRDRIVIKPSRWAVYGDIGYIRLSAFNGNAQSALEESFSAIQDQLEGRLKGLVLDLRGNGGGLLDQSLAVADAFIDSGRLLAIKGSHGQQAYEAKRGQLARGLPMVVLINWGSASASEIVAGALQDHGRALIMGQRSFGKGTVQTVAPLPMEGALRLTTQLYYTPKGRSIQSLGVEPDIRLTPRVEPGKAPPKPQREADLPNALPPQFSQSSRTSAVVEAKSCPPIEVNTKKDWELGCALEYLRSGSAGAFLGQYRASDRL